MAKAILADRRTPPETLAAPYVTDEVPDVKEALAGARDILTEGLAEDAALLGRLRSFLQQGALLAAKGRQGPGGEGRQVFRLFRPQRTLGAVPSHRAPAMKRGANDGVLTLGVGAGPETGLPQVDAMVSATLGG